MLTKDYSSVHYLGEKTSGTETKENLDKAGDLRGSWFVKQAFNRLGG